MRKHNCGYYSYDKFICRKCGHTFFEDDAEETRKRTSYNGGEYQDWSFWEYAIACPECESLDIDPIDFNNDTCKTNPKCDGRCMQGEACPYYED